jgi:hypothetical protein
MFVMEFILECLTLPFVIIFNVISASLLLRKEERGGGCKFAKKIFDILMD